VAITGASEPTYTAAAADAGSALTVDVTATNGSGSASAEATPTAAVTAPPANTAPPSIGGSAAQGHLLTASTGSWSGYPAPTYSYEWERCETSSNSCLAISGATGSSYTAQPADAGSTLLVTVKATNGSGSASAEATPTAAVTAPPANTALPIVTGTATVGQQLSASTGTWNGYPTPTYSYQWKRCNNLGQSCVAIAEASEPTYTTAAADTGSTLTVDVTATNTSGSIPTETKPTAVVTVPPANTAPPSITGSAAQGQLLTASTGSWSGYPAPTYSYQWERCEALGNSCAAISGATNPTYTIQSADAGSTLIVVVTASNSSGSSAADSTPTAAVAATTLGGGLGGGGDPGGGGGPGGGGSEAPPTTAQIQAALLSALPPSGKTGRIASVVKHRGYQVTFDAPGSGEVAISWYELSRGAHLAGAKPILVASGRATATAKGKIKLTLKLTAHGKSLLAHSRRLKLTGKGVFTPTGGSPVTAIKAFALR